MRKLILLSVFGLISISCAYADDDYDNFLRSALQEYNDFLSSAQREYVEWLSKPWEEIKPSITEKLKERTKPPRPIEIDDNGKDDEVEIEDNRVIKTDPKPDPKPQPIDIPKPTPGPKPQPEPITVMPKHKFRYLGNEMEVRFNATEKIRLTDTSEKSVANAWKSMSTQSINMLITDCLSLRDKYHLCDWGYMQMLDALGKSIYGDTSEATMLTAYIYGRSGYKMRIARDINNKLRMLYASRHKIYDTMCWKYNGDEYYMLGNCSGSIYISEACFAGEQPLSLMVNELPIVGSKTSSQRQRKSKYHSDMDFNVVANENLIEFYNTYPASMIDNDFMTRWAMLANAPTSPEVREKLYPAIKPKLAGLSQREQINKILNWVQTSLIYEYDDKVWGTDRAFFPDESLYYPYADCEDRAILFSRIVHDLVGVDAALIYVPGHLLAAVRLGNQEKGDCVYVNNVKYIICEATFVTGGPMGVKGNYNLNEAKVILLNPKR